MENKKKNPVATIILAVISILWMYPIALILFNSLKRNQQLPHLRFSVFQTKKPGMVCQTLLPA